MIKAIRKGYQNWRRTLKDRSRFSKIDIFICYRRSDTHSEARAIFDKLCSKYGRDRIFFDTSSIGIGNSFDSEARNALASSKVMLVIIGNQWLESFKQRENQRDSVVEEIAAGLELYESGRITQIVPINVNNSADLSQDDLPHPIKKLSTKLATPFRHSDWDNDLEKIVRSIDVYMPSTEKQAKESAVESGSQTENKDSGDEFSAAAIHALITFVAILFVAYMFDKGNNSIFSGDQPFDKDVFWSTDETQMIARRRVVLDSIPQPDTWYPTGIVAEPGDNIHIRSSSTRDLVADDDDKRCNRCYLPHAAKTEILVKIGDGIPVSTRGLDFLPVNSTGEITLGLNSLDPLPLPQKQASAFTSAEYSATFDISILKN